MLIILCRLDRCRKNPLAVEQMLLGSDLSYNDVMDNPDDRRHAADI
jgi:hypothetical protein